MSPSRLLDLPEELLAEVLLYLNYRSILRCAQTCKRLSAHVSASQSLQYVIELAAMGMKDGPSNHPLSTVERLALLQKHKKQRREFNPLKICDIEIECPQPEYIFDFVDGFFVCFYERDGAAHLRVYDLSPSKTGDRLLSHTQLDPRLLDLSIDPSRDLFVYSAVAEYEPGEPGVHLHLRTLSSGGLQQHPEAALARLGVFDDRAFGFETDLMLAGDMVAYLSERALYIYCWTTGLPQVLWTLAESKTWLNTFTFISPSAFILTESKTGDTSFRLYSLPLSSNSADSPPSLSDAPFTRYHLPKLRARRSTILSVHTGPFSTPYAPFSHDKRIVILFASEIDTKDVIATEMCYVIRTDAFLGQNTRPHVEAVLWNDWGPKNARILPYLNDTMLSVRGAHGSEFFLAVLSNKQDANQLFLWQHVYFNFADACDAQFIAARQENTAPLRSVRHPTRMVTKYSKPLDGPGGIFREPVETLLPYYSTRTDWNRDDLDEFLLGDDLMVGMTYEEDAERITLEVYGF